LAKRQVFELRDGDFDGTPPLSTTRAVHAWTAVCARRFLQLRADPARNVLRAYGAENEAEFDRLRSNSC
jgi:Mlc titration factor MtfA (ptsG expression regulator)